MVFQYPDEKVDNLSIDLTNIISIERLSNLNFVGLAFDRDITCSKLTANIESIVKQMIVLKVKYVYIFYLNAHRSFHKLKAKTWF